MCGGGGGGGGGLGGGVGGVGWGGVGWGGGVVVGREVVIWSCSRHEDYELYTLLERGYIPENDTPSCGKFTKVRAEQRLKNANFHW